MTRSKGAAASPDDIRSLNVSINERFNEMSERFETMHSEMILLNQMLKSKDESVLNLSEEVKSLKKKVSELENLVDNEDSYVRRESLIFSGSAIPPSQPGEICSQIVRDVIKTKLKLEIAPMDISVSHRLGQKPAAQGPDTRSIIAKFCRRDTKRMIRLTRFDNNDVNSKLFINESLTPKRRTILYALRKMRRNTDIVTGCSTFEGKIFAYTKNPGIEVQRTSKPNDRKHAVNTHEELINFCREFVKKPLEDFLDSWDH